MGGDGLLMSRRSDAGVIDFEAQIRSQTRGSQDEIEVFKTTIPFRFAGLKLEGLGFGVGVQSVAVLCRGGSRCHGWHDA